MRGARASIVDFDDPAKNELLVVRQLQIVGSSGKTIRPDLTVFLNGMPMVGVGATQGNATNHLHPV